MSGVNVMGGETNIVFFGPDIGDVVNSGGQEVVVGPGYGYTYGHSNAYGTTYGTVVNSGGQESVQGGVIIGTLVNDVGQEFVSGGSAIGTVVNGEQYVYGGNFVGVGSVDGLATSTTVNSGGEQYVYDYATANDTVVNRGGNEYLFDYATASGTVVNGAQYVYDYATASNTVLNGGGTLFANGGTVDVAEAIKGGSILIGNGMVDVQQASADNVTFQLGGRGGLTLFNAKGYTGKVSGFGDNGNQFIDFTAIGSAGATFSYTSTSAITGVLTVISGGTSANIDLSGHYSSANFHIRSGIGGSVEIFDPPVALSPPTVSADLALFVNYWRRAFRASPTTVAS